MSSHPPLPVAPLSGPPLRVLLAEDDNEMRRLLAATLRRNNCQVVEAKNGTQLWELISLGALGTRFDPLMDLVVSDVRMPGASGMEVLARVRSCNLSIPVIMITAFGDPELHAEAKRLGALAVFNKPFELDDLRVVVCSLQRTAPVLPMR